MKTHDNPRPHLHRPCNQTWLLIRSTHMRRPHYDCRDFAGCLDAPELIPAGSGHSLLRRSEVSA